MDRKPGEEKQEQPSTGKTKKGKPTVKSESHKEERRGGEEKWVKGGIKRKDSVLRPGPHLRGWQRVAEGQITLRHNKKSCGRKRGKGKSKRTRKFREYTRAPNEGKTGRG